MTFGPVQTVPSLPNDLEGLPTDIGVIERVDPSFSRGNRTRNWPNSVKISDPDPLTWEELFDLSLSEAEVRAGRYLVVSEDITDEELFRMLESE